VRARASGCVPAGVRVCVRVPVSASACVRWRVRALRESIHSRANDPAILATSPIWSCQIGIDSFWHRVKTSP